MKFKFFKAALASSILVVSSLAQAGIIKVAVWEDSFASTITGYNTVNANPLKTFLEDGDNYDFQVTYVTKANIEAGLLSSGGFDTFLVGGKEHVRWSDAMALNTSNYVLSGGGYVGMGWGATYSTQSLSSAGYNYLQNFQPTTQTSSSYNNSSGSVTITDPTHDIVSGLFDYTPFQTSCCSLITASNWGARNGASVIATNNGNELIIADESGLGRGVYMGLNIGSYNIYSDQVDDNTELLLENALAWSTRAEAMDVPEPSTLAIFALGMIGLASRRVFKK